MVMTTHAHTCIMSPKSEASEADNARLATMLQYTAPPLQPNASITRESASASAEPAALCVQFEALGFKQSDKVLNDLTTHCLMNYLDAHTSLKQQGVSAAWKSNIDGMSLHIKLAPDSTISLADACAFVKRAASDGKGLDDDLFEANTQRMLSQYVMEANLPQAMCVNLVRSAAWSDGSPLCAIAPEAYVKCVQSMYAEDVARNMRRVVQAPAHVAFENTGDREALVVQHMFNVASAPRAPLRDCIAKGSSPRRLQCLRDTSDDAMRHYCAMLPFRADISDEQCEVARVASHVLGLGFNGRLMRKLRLEMQACYSVGAYFDGGLLHQPLLCVQSAFNSENCEDAVGAVRSLVRGWCDADFSRQELRMAQRARLSNARMRTSDATLKWRCQCQAAGKDHEALDKTMHAVCRMSLSKFKRKLKGVADMTHFAYALSS